MLIISYFEIAFVKLWYLSLYTKMRKSDIVPNLILTYATLKFMFVIFINFKIILYFAGPPPHGLYRI